MLLRHLGDPTTIFLQKNGPAAEVERVPERAVEAEAEHQKIAGTAPAEDVGGDRDLLLVLLRCDGGGGVVNESSGERAGQPNIAGGLVVGDGKRLRCFGGGEEGAGGELEASKVEEAEEEEEEERAASGEEVEGRSKRMRIRHDKRRF